MFLCGTDGYAYNDFMTDIGGHTGAGLRVTRREALFIVLCFAGIGALGLMSVRTMPQGGMAAWWPSAGVAVGLGVRFPKSRGFVLSLSIAIITMLLGVATGRSIIPTVAIGLASGAEMWSASWIMRGSEDALPDLARANDAMRFMWGILAGAVAFDIIASIGDLASADPASAWDRLISAAPRHAAGILLVTPFFVRLPTALKRASLVETIAQIMVVAGISVGVFVINPNLPFAFLPLIPLLWAATRFSTRFLMSELLMVAVIASVGSGAGRGPFSFERLGSIWGSVVLQTFELSTVLVFLALSLSLWHQHELESAELKRAGDIQRALLPLDIPKIAGWDFGAVFAPARSVGGDFYDVRRDNANLALIVADVMGKGVGSGMLAAAARSILRARSVKSDPVGVVRGLSHQISNDLSRAGAFMTLAQIRLDWRTGIVRMADAGHGLIFICRGSLTIRRIESGGLPIGIGTDWSANDDVLEVNDSLIVVSDGLLDFWSDSIDLLQQRLLNVLTCNESAQTMVDMLTRDPVRKSDRDDITAVILRRMPVGDDDRRAVETCGVNRGLSTEYQQGDAS